MDLSLIWNISGPAFLVGFVLAGLLLTGFALCVQFWAEGHLPRTRELQGYVLAYSGEGGLRGQWTERRLLAACLVTLRVKGLIAVECDGTLRPIGEGDDLTDPLDRAVFQAVVQGTEFKELSWHRPTQDELRSLRRKYDDWAKEAHRAYFAQMRRTRLALLPLVFLWLVGAARLWESTVLSGSGGFLLALLVALGAGIAALARWWVPDDLPRGLYWKLRQRTEAMVRERLRELGESAQRGGADSRADEAVLRMVFFKDDDSAAVDPELHAMLQADGRRRRVEEDRTRRRREAEKAEAEARRRRAAEIAEQRRREAEERRKSSGSAGGGPFSSGSSYGGVYDGGGGGGGGGGCGGCGGGD